MNHLIQNSSNAATIFFLSMALCLSLSVQAKPTAENGTVATTDALPANVTENRYRERIDNLSREIKTDKALYTALVTRMESIRKKLQNIRSEEGRETGRKPSLLDGIATIDQHIEELDSQLKEKESQLEDLKKVAQSQPVPTLLEDALGGIATIEKHRALAIQNYLMHKSKVSIQQSREQQQKLHARRMVLTQTSETLQATLGDYQSTEQDLIKSRLSLEIQFTDLLAAIARKQDRHDQLSQHLQNVKFTPKKATFASHRGDLRDPTAGILQHRYAEPKAQGLLEWEGILVAAPLGQNIEAVFDGTVVFADHIHGLGDVAILDHGEGYMSLYGMADFLVVELGQQVIIGDTIGTVGSLTGNDESTLYFEIRHDANTLDPEKWLGLRQISQDNEP